jgi:DNA-directed RNA polymerase subunit K/omega
MNVKIDYASINDEDEPLKLHPKRDDMDDEDEDDNGGVESDGETSVDEEEDDNDDMEDDDAHEPNGNDTSDSDNSEGDENSDNGNVSDGQDKPVNANEDEYEEDDANDDASNNDDDDESVNGIDDDTYDDDDAEEESRYRKINQDFRRNYITETHPETNTHTEDEIHALAKVVRDKIGIIVDPLHRTVPILTKYEKTRILGIRTKQLNNGAEPFISSKLNITSEKIIDGYPIALKELEEKKLPFIIRRPLPGGGVEYWYLQDLEVL